MKISEAELQTLISLGHWYGLRGLPYPVINKHNYEDIINYFVNLRIDKDGYIEEDWDNIRYTLNYDNPEIRESFVTSKVAKTESTVLDYSPAEKDFLKVLPEDQDVRDDVSKSATEKVAEEVEPQSSSSVNPILDRIDYALETKDVNWFLDEFNMYSVFYNCSKQKVEEIGHMLTPYVVETYPEIFEHPIKGSDVIKILHDFPYFKVVRELYRSLPIMLYKCFRFMVYDNEWDKELFVILYKSETKQQREFLKENNYYIADAIQEFLRSTNEFIELPQ